MSTEKGKLNFWEVYSIGVGGMIGGGIFATLGLSLQLAGGAAPIAFAFAGLVALLTSYSYAKLSSRYPSIGGTIEFLIRGFGDRILTGGLNILLLASYIVMIALYAHAFGSYGASMIPNHYQTAYFILTLIAISSLTVTNLLGAVISGRVELTLVAFKLGVLLLVALIGFTEIKWIKLSPNNWPSFADIIAGGMIIFLAYEGFELISNTAMDAKDTTILRKSYYSSVATAITVYILIAIVAAGALTKEQVIEARDYALAILAKPILGEFGVILIVAAALASTSSAINATLYGTARMSYLVAKYGEAPRVLGRRIWHGAYEGLIIIAVLSLMLTLGAGLKAISAAGSGGFLVLFTAVNLAAYRLREKISANSILTLSGAVFSLVSLVVLIIRMIQLDPTQLLIFIVMIIGSISIEYVYRSLTGRTLPKYVDPRLAEREKLLNMWEHLSLRIARIVRSAVREAEVYLIGSHARNQAHKAGDLDILIVTDKPLSPEEKERIKQRVERDLGLPAHHPIHFHTTTKGKLYKYKYKKKLDHDSSKLVS